MLALGFSKRDMFTDRLTTPALMAIVSGCHPGTAVHHSLTEGWPIEAHLLANMSEQSAGMIRPTERYRRPGLPKAESSSGTDAFGFETFSTIEAFEARRQQQFNRGGVS